METVNSSTPETEIKIKSPDIIENPEPVINENDLSTDPDFLKLLEYYQHAEFTKCNEVLTMLEGRYPEHPRLIRFKDDLQMQLSVKNMVVKNKKEQTNKARKITLKMSVFAIVSTILVMAIVLFAYFYISNNAKISQAQSQTAQLTSLNNQAEQLILAGRPQPAAEIIANIKALNPAYENLQSLTARTDELLRLEEKYKAAQSLVLEKKNAEALAIFKEIEAEMPGLWDVNKQIASIDTTLQLEKCLEEGNSAYQKENWDKVISSYESALSLAPKLDDPVIKEQLFKAYLNKIIGMLRSQSSSIDDVEKAEQYYRRASSLIPQSKTFSSERVNLQEVSSDLLVIKFTQTAKAMLADKNQTVSSIANAVSFLRKAANLKPKNTALQSDLVNGEYYRIGFQNFVEMEWVPAITNLSEIVAADPNYAGGNASLLLYEAYYALGKQYYSVGLYLDARKNLEQAEILAWGNSDNLMKLFQVQALLGDAIGKTADYKNAVSYYKYALDAIQAKDRLKPFPSLLQKLTEGEALVEAGNFKDASAVFQDLLKVIEVIYTTTEVKISDGVCLAFFANENASTVDAIAEVNNLSNTMVITFGRTLRVPSITN